MNPTQNDLPLKKREKLVDLLNARLADILDLKLQAKQAHWNVKGPNFIALHELFDEVASRLEDLSDILAERALQLGGPAHGTLAAIAGKTQLPAYPLDITKSEDHLKALTASQALVGKAIREAIDQADELGDADTADIFTEVSRALDKDLWFVESHLQ